MHNKLNLDTDTIINIEVTFGKILHEIWPVE